MTPTPWGHGPAVLIDTMTELVKQCMTESPGAIACNKIHVRIPGKSASLAFQIPALEPGEDHKR
uniref:Uncharacterized protein n=1 Tax=Aegilops tauschii TaxID=37682 RepID=M8CS27_AEGTA